VQAAIQYCYVLPPAQRTEHEPFNINISNHPLPLAASSSSNFDIIPIDHSIILSIFQTVAPQEAPPNTQLLTVPLFLI
jgi:hypothetical protein